MVASSKRKKDRIAVFQKQDITASSVGGCSQQSSAIGEAVSAVALQAPSAVQSAESMNEELVAVAS